MSSPGALALAPPATPRDAVVDVPGSKSFTNRALAVAALARGTSELAGTLVADDARAMRDALRALGIAIAERDGGRMLVVEGCGGRAPASGAVLHAGSAGTAARFLPPLLATGSGDYVLDGSAQLRGRPLGELVGALRTLGVPIAGLERPDALPLRIGGTRGVLGPAVAVGGATSSQFLSGLLLSAPCYAAGLVVTVDGELVSKPYVDITLAVMRAFGARVEADGHARFAVAPGGYEARRYAIEPDASAASYFFAAAAIGGRSVTVRGLGRHALQGDLGFVRVLEQMGCRVELGDAATTVTGGALHGVDVDLRDLSDTAQTLAAVAPFAASPTRIRGIGFIRRKESDRVGAVVRELQRAGIDAIEEPDGMLIRPGAPRPCRIATYDDHRMAMSFALLGLRAEGIEIADPGCTAKTYPGYFADLAAATGIAARPVA